MIKSVQSASINLLARLWMNSAVSKVTASHLTSPKMVNLPVSVTAMAQSTLKALITPSDDTNIAINAGKQRIK